MALSADRYINSRFIPDIELIKRATAVRSPKSSGKTEWLKREIAKRLERNPNTRIKSITPLTALTKAQAERLGLTCYKGLTNQELTQAKLLAITPDSNDKINRSKGYWIDLLLLDELEMLLTYIATSKTCKGKRHQIIAALKWDITHAREIIVTDADYSPVSQNFLCKVLGPENVELIVNRYAVPGKNFIGCSSPEQVYQAIATDLDAGLKTLYVATNTLNGDFGALTLYKNLFQKYPDKRFLLICSETNSSNEDHDRLAHLNEIATEYDAIIVSPSVNSGVDLNARDVFYRVYLIGQAGVNDHWALLQMAGRVRYPVTNEVIFWVAEYKGQGATDPEKLIKDMIAVNKDREFHLEIDENGEWTATGSERFKLELWADVTARHNASMSDYRAMFLIQCEADGNNIYWIADEDELSEKAKEVIAHNLRADKHEIEFARREAILVAPDIDDYAARNIEDKEQAGHKLEKGEKARLERYKLRRFYGETPISESLLEFDKKGRGRAATKAYAASHIGFYAEMRDLREQTSAGKWITDFENLTVKARAREMMLQNSLGWSDGQIQNRDWFTQQDLIDNGFMQYITDHKDWLESRLHTSINVKAPVQALALVLKSMGLKLERQVIKTGKKKITKAQRLQPELLRKYRLDSASAVFMDNVARNHFKALAERLLEREGQIAAPPDLRQAA